MKIPVSLIVDDPAPIISVYYEHVGRRTTSDGRPIIPTFPNEFLDRFCDIVEKHGIKGKFSVIPMPGNKGDIVKIIGGDVRYDEYTQSQYSMNTNFNTQISINPQNLSIEQLDEFESLKNELRPTPIGEIYAIDEDGIELDVVGRILSIDDSREFDRDDGTVGIVRSILFADESGKVRLSLWMKVLLKKEEHLKKFS